MSDAERTAVAVALGQLRHLARVGSLTPHDAGLVAGAIRSLESVTSGDRPRGGLAGVIGQWPGDETDEQLDAVLRELS